VEFEHIIYEKPWKMDGAVRIMINRPKALNAFAGKTAGELEVAFRDAVYDDGVGVIVLTGAGDRAFCVGGDARDVGPGKAGYSPEMKRIFEVHRYIREAPKPVIAAVNGWAIGGGHVLHVICDLSIAAETARFGQVGPRVGSFDAGFGSAYLARVVGEKKAREIWFLCRNYSAQEALEMGLVNKVVPAGAVLKEAQGLARKIVSKSKFPTAAALRAISKGLQVSIEEGLKIEAEQFVILAEKEDPLEGLSAFLEKRQPQFKDR